MTAVIDQSTQAAVTTRHASVSLVDVTKDFGTHGNVTRALDGLTFHARPGEFVCLVGASGCGKTTLLNLIAGLESPSSGTVTVSGRVGLMFQESALFPWLTVSENVAIALKLQRTPRRDRAGRVAELLDLVHLGAFGDKRPHELSGGMRQRVALARALAQNAEVLLMDEPFAALDAMTRDVMHDELERIWSRTGATVIFVTHNVREAVRLADRVVLLSSRPGRVAGEFTIDVPRPRRIDSADVATPAHDITDKLRTEVARHGHR